MKKIFFCFLLSINILASLHAQTNAATQSTMSKTLLRHVVMFGWKEGTDSAAIQTVIDAFKALPGKISLIKQFEWGTKTLLPSRSCSTGTIFLSNYFPKFFSIILPLPRGVKRR